MPAIAALTINDGATTPVAHTFSPANITGNKAEWQDRSPVTPAGYRKFHHEVSQPSPQRTTHKMTFGLYNPTEAVVNGSTVVARSCAAQLTLNFPPDSTLQERKDTLAYMANFLANASVKSSVENIEPFY